jgi:hypothetical protein
VSEAFGRTRTKQNQQSNFKKETMSKLSSNRNLWYSISKEVDADCTYRMNLCLRLSRFFVFYECGSGSGAYPKTHLHIRTFTQMFPAKFVMCNRFSNPKHICTSAHTHEKTLPNGTIKQLFYATFITLIRINNVYTMGV